MGDRSVRAALRALLRSYHHDLYRRSDAELQQLATQALLEGRLVITSDPASTGGRGSYRVSLSGAGPAAEESLGPQEEEEPSWIEFRLVDANNEPAEGVDYVVVLTDGSEQRGQLDGSGSVRFEDIDPGSCKIFFPKAERAAVQEITHQVAAEETDWLEIELLDEQDRPIADEPFKVELADGSVQEGKLGQNGRARVEGVKPGACQVSFPEREPAVVLAG